MGQNRHYESDEKEARARRAQPQNESRPRVQTHDPDEDREANGVEDPERGLGDAPERGAHRAEPTEDPPHDEGPFLDY